MQNECPSTDRLFPQKLAFYKKECGVPRDSGILNTQIHPPATCASDQISVPQYTALSPLVDLVGDYHSAMLLAPYLVAHDGAIPIV